MSYFNTLHWSSAPGTDGSMLMAETRTRVLLIDDHRIFLDALKVALDASGCFEVVGIATSSEAGLEAVEKLRPQMVLCDLQLPGAGGFSLAGEVTSRFPEIRVVVLTGFVSEALIQIALQQGVSGYLLKTDPFDQLLQSLTLIARGEHSYSPTVRAMLAFDGQGRAHPRRESNLGSLSPHQIEVLRHLARGASVKEVAKLMHATTKAIDSQKYRIMKHLGIHDRVMLAHFALEHGLISNDQPEATSATAMMAVHPLS